MAAYKRRKYTREFNPYTNAEKLRTWRRVFPRGSKWPWVIAFSLFIMALTIGSFSLSLLLSVSSVMSKADVAIDSAGSFLTAAKSGDQELLKQSAQSVSKAAHEIDAELNEGIWEFSSRLPIVGSDVESVRTLAAVFIDFSDTALIPMSESGNILALKDFAKDDHIDFAALPSLLVAVDEVIPALNRTTRTLESLPHANIPPFARVLDSVTEKLSTVNSFVTRIRPMFPYLPDLFGADGNARHYLVLAENDAEIHAIGGFVGALGILTVDNGKISMGDFQDLAEVLSHDRDSAGATAEEIDAFGERCDTHHGDHNIVPDFSRVGQLYFNSWNFYQDSEVDGVLGFDVVFLQYLLDAFGPIETSAGVTVDGTNCAAVLLNQSLFWWEPEQCDVFYREVASEALSRILGNLDDIDFSKLIGAVTNAVDEDRCSIWVRDESIEDALKITGFARELEHDSSKPELGIFISDFSISKMSYYLSADIEVGDPIINEDGSQSYDVTVTYTNNFDPNARSVFPSYIRVARTDKRTDCDTVQDVRLLAPEGGRIENLSSRRENTTGEPPADTAWSDHTYQGIEVKAATFRMDAKESVVINFTVVTSPDARNPLIIRKTPLMPPEIAYWNMDLSEQHPEWNIEKTI